jgi:integrase
MTQTVPALLGVRAEGKGQPDWLFTAEKKSEYVTAVDSWHRRALEKVEIADPLVLYSLRPTYGTRLGEAGVEAFIIQKLMDHPLDHNDHEVCASLP